jgi:hypothetical protein
MAVSATFLVLTFAPALFASSSAWTVLNLQDTGVSRQGESLAAISANGEIYSVTGRIYTTGSCPAPTLAVGDGSQGSSCVTKRDPSGHQIFSVQIGGADLQALALDAAGNAYIAGFAGPTGAGFATTTNPTRPAALIRSSAS